MFLLIFAKLANGQTKDTKWFERSDSWDFLAEKIIYRSLNEQNNIWKTDNEFIQELPILITNNYITLLGETPMKYEILDAPFMTYTPNDKEKEFSYMWLKLWDTRRKLNCSGYLEKNRSNGGSLIISYKNPKTGNYVFMSQFFLK